MQYLSSHSSFFFKNGKWQEKTMTLDRQVDQKKKRNIILTITKCGIFWQIGQDWVSQTSSHGPVKTSFSFCNVASCLFSSQNNVSVSYTMKSAPIRTGVEFHSGLLFVSDGSGAQKIKGWPVDLKDNSDVRWSAVFGWCFLEGRWRKNTLT